MSTTIESPGSISSFLERGKIDGEPATIELWQQKLADYRGALASAIEVNPEDLHRLEIDPSKRTQLEKISRVGVVEVAA